MKKCLLLLGFLVLILAAFPAASSEAYKQCLLNCPTGANECTKGCDKQFEVSPSRAGTNASKRRERA